MGYFLEVGKPYSEARRTWPETVQYNYRGGTHELLLFYNGPRPAEIHAIQEERAAFALATYLDVIYLCFKFGDQPWSDAGYSWHLVSEEERELPPEWEEEEARALLTTVLIDARSGLVKALRVSTFSPAFTRALHDAIRAQAARPWPGMEEYQRQGSRVYAGYTSAQIAQKLAKVRCIGGE